MFNKKLEQESKNDLKIQNKPGNIFYIKFKIII